MKVQILSFFLLLAAVSLHGLVPDLSVGKTLPDLKGEYLTGKTAILPQAASGRVALLVLGFTYDSRSHVEAWTNNFRKQMGANPRATFYEIPMIGGMARLGKWLIASGMRKGTPKADHENVITLYGSTDAWKQRVGFKDPKGAYLILIDAKGSVASTNSSPYSEAGLHELLSESRKLPGESK